MMNDNNIFKTLVYSRKKLDCFLRDIKSYRVKKEILCIFILVKS